MKKTLRALGIGLAMAFMVGCGAEAPSMSPNAGRNLNGLVINAPQTNPTNGQNQATDPRALLAEIATRYQSIDSLSSQVVTYDTNGSKTVSSRTSAVFQKPAKISMQVLEHTDSKAVGTKIVYLGSGQLNVKTKFFGFQVKLNLDLTDSRMCSTRGNTLAETGIVRMMNILLDSSAQTRVLGQGSLNGKPVTIIEVISSRSLKGITKEIYYIDQQEKIPVVREMYEGSKLVFRNQFLNVILNARIAPNAFTLD